MYFCVELQPQKRDGVGDLLDLNCQKKKKIVMNQQHTYAKAFPTFYPGVEEKKKTCVHEF